MPGSTHRGPRGPGRLPPAEEIADLTYLKCPLVDDDSAVPDPAVTVRLATFVSGLLDEGRRTLVHCTLGRNRSGLITGP